MGGIVSWRENPSNLFKTYRRHKTDKGTHRNHERMSVDASSCSKSEA